MINRQKERTCYDCKHVIVITEKDEYDLGGDEDADYECINSKVDYGFLARSDFNYEDMAKTCKYFDPAEYEYRCPICMEQFIFSQPAWDHWIEKYDNNEPVCSKECKDKFYAKNKN